MIDNVTVMDKRMTIDAILSIDQRFTREYLNTLSLDALHDLEDAILSNTALKFADEVLMM